MHYYQFNIGDYASHTRHLSPIEDIAYRRLLDQAYTTELPLTKDLHTICRIIDMREHRQAVEDVLKEFWLEVVDGWINNRVCKEIEKTGKKSESAKNAAAIRWHNERNAKAMQAECKRNANASGIDANASKNYATHNPLPITQDTVPKKQCASSADANANNFFSGVDAQIIEDFKKLRTKLKAPITKTVMDGILREAEKAGITLQAALQMCCERSWRGFKAEWITANARASPAAGISEATKAAAHKRLFGEQPAGRVIDA